MSVMNDLFKRGYQFDSVTGQKTGANLEDLVTRAVPVAGTQLVDQSTLEDYADATIVDDAAAAIRRLRVKDGGITGAKLAKGAFLGGPLLSGLVTAGAALQSGGAWTVAYPNLANGLTEDAGNDSGEGYVSNYGTNGNTYYWDLGAIYIGSILMVANQKGTGGLVGPFSAYDGTHFTVDGFPSKQYDNLWRVDGSTYYAWSQIVPFIGRYVGFRVQSGNGVYVYTKINRFNVYGVAV